MLTLLRNELAGSFRQLLLSGLHLSVCCMSGATCSSEVLIKWFVSVAFGLSFEALHIADQLLVLDLVWTPSPFRLLDNFAA